MTKLEILKETYDYYTEDVSRRAVIETISEAGLSSYTCSYRISEDKKCAIGRCFNEIEDFGFEGSIGRYIKEKGVKNVDTILLPQYHGHDLEFWSYVQGFHDSGAYWDKEKGLTKEGQQYYDDLVYRYSEDPIK